ncbi:ABC transporter permease [Modestobacter sp. VKM Ac-2978]|uniref:ABC transporter permease n=1 Tax=Modestobacter sp. VKM Ac-2978 TaxID=3004132 RepID=UPI0022AA0709|nr:ABC transporter permease [Modestobacter sp. VKM Ac-2978]MCZ2849679.1 ABC transporter permease [Modestobacter sp. VKM Ac-2978]
MTAPTADAAAPTRHPSFAHTVRAEWIKLRSLRSTWYTLAGLVVVGLGITWLATGSAAEVYAGATADGEAWDPTNLSLTSYLIAQLIIGVLGILVVTSEYATGLIQTTLAATPNRSRLLAGKLVVSTAVAVVAGQLLMFAIFFLGQLVIGGQDVPNASIGDPGVLSAVVGGGLYLAAIALLAVGLGTILRATAGALATLVGIIFLVPAMAALFPSWLQGLVDFWPSQGAAAVMATVPVPDQPHPWLNLGGMFLGVLAVLVGAFVVFRRRDV